MSHDHGGPVRLYVAPMYFYKSLKWLDSITVADGSHPATGRSAGTTPTPGWGNPTVVTMLPSSEQVRRFTPGQRWTHLTFGLLMGVLIVTAALLYIDALSTLVGRRNLVATIHFFSGLLLPIPLVVAACVRRHSGPTPGG